MWFINDLKYKQITFIKISLNIFQIHFMKFYTTKYSTSLPIEYNSLNYKNKTVFIRCVCFKKNFNKSKNKIKKINQILYYCKK
jgi:hypothetical protein